MSQFLLLSLLLALWSSTLVTGRGSGAPSQACLDLKPRHNSAPPQPLATSPFIVNATKQIDDTFGTVRVLVTISSPVNHTLFRGFILQARYYNNPDLLVDGEFMPSEGFLTKTYECKLAENWKHNNTWTHRSNKEKEQVSAIWTPPEDFSEDIVIMGTVVLNKATFWEKQRSQLVSMDHFAPSEPEGEPKEKPTSSQSHEDAPDHGANHYEADPETAKPSAMDESHWVQSNFTETVASTHSGSGNLVSGSENLVLGSIGALTFALLGLAHYL